MIRTNPRTPAAAYRKPRNSPMRHFGLSPEALQPVASEEAWAAVVVAAAKTSGGQILRAVESRLCRAE